MSFISYLLNGISLGSVYAIIALGYTMVYGIAKMLNFAHGDILMVGGYAAFLAFNQMGLGIPLSILLSMAICTALGVLVERIAYKPLRSANSLAVLITAIGVSYLLQNLALLFFGANPKSFQSFVKIPALKLARATAMKQPPSDKGKRLKLFYITQASVSPPTFVLFVNDRELMHFSYTRYIENQIRESFGFRGTPIRFIIRERGED